MSNPRTSSGICVSVFPNWLFMGYGNPRWLSTRRSASTWPFSQRKIDDQMKDLSAETLKALLHNTAWRSMAWMHR